MFFFSLIIRKFSKRKIQIFFYFDYLVLFRERRNRQFFFDNLYQEQLYY